MQDQEWIYAIVTSRVLRVEGLEFEVKVYCTSISDYSNWYTTNLQNASGIDNSEELVWQLVFIASHPACSNFAYQMTNQTQITPFLLQKSFKRPTWTCYSCLRCTNT